MSHPNHAIPASSVMNASVPFRVFASQVEPQAVPVPTPLASNALRPAAATPAPASSQPVPVPVPVPKLAINPKTVRNHLTNIFSKLQVADRAQAIRRARSIGLR